MEHDDGQRRARKRKTVQYGDERRKRIKNKYRNKQYDVTVIDATQAVVLPDEEPQKKKVCAYCRVSTEDDAQLSSYELQVQYYQEYINSHPDWELIEIYADEGISGTSTKKRESFKRMIRDCEAGKIDYIVTKSISRFARNVLDCLTYVRKLKNLPRRVGVYFEKERMDTLDDKSEFTLSVLSSMAQEESRSISTNISWAIKRRFERGIPLCPTSMLLGYDTDEEGEMFIVRGEAEIVRMIFDRYIAGMSFRDIAEMLNQLGYRTIRDNPWSDTPLPTQSSLRWIPLSAAKGAVAKRKGSRNRRMRVRHNRPVRRAMQTPSQSPRQSWSSRRERSRMLRNLSRRSVNRGDQRRMSEGKRSRNQEH